MENFSLPKRAFIPANLSVRLSAVLLGSSVLLSISESHPPLRFERYSKDEYFYCSSRYFKFNDTSSDFLRIISRFTDSNYSEGAGLQSLSGKGGSVSFLPEFLTAMAARQKGRFLDGILSGLGWGCGFCDFLRKGACSLRRAGLRSCSSSCII